MIQYQGSLRTPIDIRSAFRERFVHKFSGGGEGGLCGRGEGVRDWKNGGVKKTSDP